MTVRIAIHGAAGRMGRAIAAAIAGDPDVRLVAAIGRGEAIGRDVFELAGVGAPSGVIVSSALDAIADADVVIDFSSPAATARLATFASSVTTKFVVGTTGLDAAASAAIDGLAKTRAVLVAPNTSVGVTVLFHLAAQAARLLGPGFDAEIVEIHHRKKVDAPSGTALRLAERVAEAKGITAQKHGRSGQVGARPDDEIGVLALRAGDVIGEHTLYLAGPGERIEITHRAHDRSLFARGALRAAKWIASQSKPGRYDMNDVLGIVDV